MEQNPEVLIVMGSDSDFPLLQPAFQILSRFGIRYDAVVCSAHRTPDAAAILSKEAEERGIKVIIAAAGLAAHLPGVIAAYTTLPVIGVPISSGALKGIDSLYSMVQMPAGIPVATVTINGSENASILAIQILALNDPDLRLRLIDYKKQMVDIVDKKNDSLQKKLKDSDY